MTSSTDGLYSEATEAKRAARLAAYLEEYGAEEDETRLLLRYVSWFGTGACLLCGIALASALCVHSGHELLDGSS